jgi:TrmH family RNA methyltransferase
MKITSPANPRIRSVIKLSRKTERIRSGLMPIEGLREISRALDGETKVLEAYFCPDIGSSAGQKRLIDSLKASGARITEVSAAVYGKIAYRESAGGILAVAERGEHPLADLPERDDHLIIVVDHLEKPGNLGAIFRSADGAGATGVIISDPSAEISNPNVIRASLGTVFTVPKAVAPATEAIRWLTGSGISIVAATPGDGMLWNEADLASPSAIVLGSEDSGLGDEWLKASDIKVRIPMRGAADSLNVSATAAILLYEAIRQRLGSG